MKKVMMLLFLISLLFAGALFADEPTDPAKEKPLVIKGLSIGMNGNDARTIMQKIVGNDWLLTQSGTGPDICKDYKDGDDDVFQIKTSFDNSSSPSYFSNPILAGKYGFAIKNNKNYFAGFIGIDEKSNKVIRIAFGKKLTDYIFNSGEVSADDFVEQFRGNYNMPAFYWIPKGWQHKSPYGYTVQIYTNKRLDIQSSGKISFD